MALSRTGIVAGLVALAAAGGLAWLALRPQPVPVDLAEAVRGPLVVTVNADGTTRIRDIFEVSAPVGGRVLRAPVAVGQAVVAGETLVALIEPGEPAFLDARSRLQAEAAVREAEAALDLALANVSAARTALALAEAQEERLERLYTRGSLPEAEMERARLDRLSHQARLDAALAERALRESALERQRAMLVGPAAADDAVAAVARAEACCLRLMAPVSGHVLRLDNPSARMVAPGTPLMEIGQLDDLEIVVELLSGDAVRLRPGAPAMVERWGGEGVLEARLREIEPAAFTRVSALGIEEQRVRAVLDLETPPEGRAGLGHGFRVFVRLVEWEGADVVSVPLSALFRHGEGWAVYAEEEGRAVLRPVEPGRRGAARAEIVAGLEEGARVITHPSDRVAPGVPVISRADLGL